MNPDPALAELEARVMKEANELGVGAMGFGGQCVADRLQDRGGEPAAGQFLRVGGVRLLGVPAAGRAARCATGAITKWLYRDPVAGRGAT